MGVPEYLITIIKIIYVNNQAYVRVESDLSESFQKGQGVRQGCILSPLLFNIYGDWIMRQATQEWNRGISMGGRKISNLRYADDTVLLAQTEL